MHHQFSHSRFTVRQRSLTARRLDVLRAFAQLREEQDYCPSVRELGRKLKLRSPSSVLGHLENLERDGYLKRLKRSVRPWTMTQMGKVALKAA